jgi:hypothetical protein
VAVLQDEGSRESRAPDETVRLRTTRLLATAGDLGDDDFRVAE